MYCICWFLELPVRKSFGGNISPHPNPAPRYALPASGAREQKHKQAAEIQAKPVGFVVTLAPLVGRGWSAAEGEGWFASDN